MHPSLKSLLQEIKNNMERENLINKYHEAMYAENDVVKATGYLDKAMQLCDERPLYMIEVMEEAKIERIIGH